MLSACPPLESERAAWRRAPEQTAAPPSSYLASLFRRAPSRPTAKVSPMSLDQTVTHVIRLSQARALPKPDVCSLHIQVTAFAVFGDKTVD